MKPTLSFLYFARDSLRLAAREAWARKKLLRLRLNETRLVAEHRWESEGGPQRPPRVR
jgi:hypothetical protein